MYIASAATTVKFHEFSNGKLVHNYQPGTNVEGPIRSISWSKDGHWLAVVPQAGLTEIVSVKDQLKLLHTIQDVSEPSCAVFQNSTKKCIAVGTKNGQVLVYDIKARNTKKRFPRASCMITHVEFTAKDSHCVAGCKNGDVVLYSNVSNNISSTFKVPKSASITALRTCYLKRNLIIGGSKEGVVVVWDTNVNKNKFYVEPHKAPVTAVTFSPQNPDLILSTGLDRQFCFYDILDKKCVFSGFVENSLTSVDFSPEGQYFIMASQNGKVYVYDSRSIQEPVFSYDAHNSAIRHLAFQNQPDASQNTSSFSSVNAETVITRPTQSCDDVNMNRSSLFGLFLQMPPGTDIADSFSGKPSTSMEAGDSFMTALGLDKNATKDSIKQEDNACEEEIRKFHENQTPNPMKTIHEKLGLCDSKTRHMTSTPKFISQSPMSKAMSPIISFNQSAAPINNVNVDEAQVLNSAKVAIQEELKIALEDIKSEVKYQAMHTSHQMRRMILDLQMAMVKEFIKVENYCNSIRDEINSDASSTNDIDLIEENASLKRRIVFLEEQISSLTVSSVNGVNSA